MTPAQADKAIKTGKTIQVRDAFGSQFSLKIISRDRRCIEGVYQCDGKSYDGKFHRCDLTIISEAGA